MAARTYSTPFKQHISFFDRNRDGAVSIFESFQGMLWLGLNFPFALAMCAGLHILYGNMGRFGLGGIRIDSIQRDVTQLQDARLAKTAYTRAELLTMVYKSGTLLDQVHILGMWLLAADNDGKVSSEDVALFQKGELLPALQKRRLYQENRLPFYRGGPISVTAHAYFISVLFNIPVYHAKKRD